MLATVVVLGVAAAVTVGARSQHRADHRRQERAAVAAILLAVALPNGPEAATDFGRNVALAIRNDGPTQVRIASVRVDFPGYRAVAVGRDLPAHRFLAVHLPNTPQCLTGLVEQGPQHLLVDVVTAGGTQRQLALPFLDPASGEALTGAAQDRCGLLPVSRSLDAEGDVAEVNGRREVVLSLYLKNLGVLPLQLRALDAGAGYSAVADQHLPLSLPARPTPVAPGTAGYLTVGVRIRVADCRRAVGRNDAAGQPVGELRLTVGRGSEVATQGLGFGLNDLGRALATLLHACP